MKGFKRNLRIAARAILKARTIAISGHINPDGDSIGSLLALGLALKSLGKTVYLLSQDSLPERYTCLPGASSVIREIDKKVDLAIAVDCSNEEIIGRTFQTFQDAALTLEIDHHEFRRRFADLSLIDNNAAAVGEIIYLLLKELQIKINRGIAQNLLVSIVVETNSFRLPNVRRFTFAVCAELLLKKVDFYNLVDIVFWTQSKEALILSGICLERSKLMNHGRLMWSIIRRKDFRAVGGSDEDVDAVADEMRSVKGVKIAILFREINKRLLRVSLRSKDDLNIGAIAEYYHGGGHFDVAGCTIANSRFAINELLSMADGLLKGKELF